MRQAATVLIVEDNVEVAELTCDIVESAGVRAVYRTSVSDALDYIARNAAETVGVLTDIDLASPMTGVELAVFIAAEFPHIAICVTSGVVGERPRRLPTSAAYLAKPWHVPDLLAFVQKALARGGA